MKQWQKIIVGLIVVVAILYAVSSREKMTTMSQEQTTGAWAFIGIMGALAVIGLGFMLYNSLTEKSRMKANIMNLYSN